ncbi:hypothetical protein PISMIDRAFT_119218 [Pisolithus microcarpus 441]|uniref:Uncharacterized protein n=1 Tax=Pisolithus microcarpus 441 TaxID=765257 RepID=A0A0C9Y8F6_9AGAM|nr:hypothetical protein BKA83DRAFT_119218 [Pisolithus microcarpus]KIK13231.1 hypothetical protein PISMIDRAFT_119218 [Pisolithus microcarpus 441]
MTSVLKTSCDCLLASGLYLGDSSIVGRLQWVPEGRGADAKAVGNTADLDDESGLTSQLSHDQTDTPPPKGAKLSAIVQIDQENFWLASNGSYVGPTAICKEILKVKPSCSLSNPAVEPAPSDFATVLQMLCVLTEECVTPGYSSRKSFFSMEKNKPPCFKVQHRLFEACANRLHRLVGIFLPLQVTVTHAMFHADDLFSYKLWPLTKERHCAELLALKPSHWLCPMPTYDLTNDLLIPSTSHRCLQGAIMEIHFTLSHWSIVTTRCDVYSGLIWLICILVLPVASTAAGMKRKLPLHLDIEEKPAKKGAHA